MRTSHPGNIPPSTDVVLIESASLRAQHINRTDILDKVKALRLLPDNVHASIELVASYYEVHADAIEKVIRSNRAELDEDGLKVLTGDQLSAFKAESGYQSRAASLTLLPRRAILRVGMLLRNSGVARRVRAYLLDAEVVAVPQPRRELSNRDLAMMVIAEADRADAAEAQAAILAPAAASWNTLATAEGDMSVADAAKILSRDPNISTGRNRLFTILGDLGWAYRQGADNHWRAYQSAVTAGRLSEIPQSHYHPRTGQLELDAPQVRITVKGLADLHQILGGTVALTEAA